MKQNNNNRSENSNNRYNRNAVENLKAMIKADDLEALTLAVYGIQIYAAYLTGNEYDVVIKAERDTMTGRYYFITREGVRIAWSKLNPDTLTHAAVDFMDRVAELEEQAAREVENLEKYDNTVIDSETFFYYVRPVLDILGVEWKFTAHYLTNDGRTADGVKIERPATRKPSEPVRHWLHTRPAEELAEMKADRVRKADALHKAGHYAAAVYASQLCGMISDEQTARRADDIVKAREAAKADRIRKAAELLPVGGVEIENETRTASIVVCGDERVRLTADEMRQARHLIETARELAQIETTEQTPDNDPRASYKVLAVVAIRLTDPTTTTEKTTRRGRAYVETRWPSGACLLKAEDYEAARRIADHLTDTPATEHKTVAEVLADYDKSERAEDERKAAAKVAAAPADVLADMYGDKTRAEVLAVLLSCDTDHAADLLAEMTNTTDPANVPDWTRYAYEIDEMKRKGCTFGQAVARVAETRARILAHQTPAEREKWAQRAADELKPTNTKADTREALSEPAKTASKAAKLATAAALFLLSLTIGTGTPARIYTHDPAAVLAEVAAAGEVVTAYDIAEA